MWLSMIRTYTCRVVSCERAIKRVSAAACAGQCVLLADETGTGIIAEKLLRAWGNSKVLSRFFFAGWAGLGSELGWVGLGAGWAGWAGLAGLPHCPANFCKAVWAGPGRATGLGWVPDARALRILYAFSLHIMCGQKIHKVNQGSFSRVSCVQRKDLHASHLQFLPKV